MERETLERDEIAQFRLIRKQCAIDPVVVHGNYLINAASPDPNLYRRSINSIINELKRCEMLGADYLVIHPGAYRSGSEHEGVRRIINAMDRIHKDTEGFRVITLLETTAGQGTYLGSRLEQLAQILTGVQDTERIGICLDTCHVFASGYDLRTAARCRKFFSEFENLIGMDRLRVIHLNDSQNVLGSRRDRHAHIGHGEIGAEAFCWIMRNRILRNIPKIIEVPKENDMDRINLDLLRGYAEADRICPKKVRW